MHYIGIGASAGGQDALCEFFDHLPPDTKGSYFVTTHLDRGHRSHLDEIIQRHTSMPVLRVRQRMLIKPGTVYVQPENASLIFADKYVDTEKRKEYDPINHAINKSFESLANAFSAAVIGIILSGKGSDGTAGIQTISAKGGKVLVQDPGSAGSRDMPLSAAGSDHPEQVARPALLARKVAQMLGTV